MRSPEFDAPSKIFFALGSSGKGSRDAWVEKVFSREIHRHRWFCRLQYALWSGCGGGMNVGASGPTPTSNGMKITPSSSTVRAGDTIQFSATVTGNTNQAVGWSVNGVASGNTTVGTIDSKGMYHAPASVPTPNSVTVQAVSTADKTLSASSPVTLQNPIPVPQA